MVWSVDLSHLSQFSIFLISVVVNFNHMRIGHFQEIIEKKYLAGTLDVRYSKGILKCSTGRTAEDLSVLPDSP
jgi:hypothetical protein